MLAGLRPVVDGDQTPAGSLRRPLLLAIAPAAELGGIASPVGTGSDGTATAALQRTHPISSDSSGRSGAATGVASGWVWRS